MPFSSWPWYAQIIAWVIAAIVLVFVFREVILPLVSKIT